MPRAYAFHVGVARPGVRQPAAHGADHTARLMHEISGELQMQPVGRANGLLIDSDATLVNVTSAFEEAASLLLDDDLLWITFSGHGKLRRCGDHEEPRNQALVLYGDQLLDDDVHLLLRKISVRAFVFVSVDACFSGSILTTPLSLQSHHDDRPQLLNPRESSAFLRRSSGWRAMQATFPAKVEPSLPANVLLLASSEDRSLSRASGSSLTATPFGLAFAAVWRDSRDYRELRANVWDLLRVQRDAIEPILNDRLLSDKALLSKRPLTI